VVNLAGAFGREADAVNAVGAENAARAAAAAGASAFVQISAIGADAGAQSDYGRSKGEGEALVRAAFPGATILRPSFIFGREDQFVNRFAGLIARAPAVPVLRGAMRMQPVYVADVAAAVVKAVADPERFGGKTLELGGPEVMTFTQFHQRLSDAIGRHPPLIDLPDFAGAGIATLGFLPGMPITWDQWLMLQTDNVAADDGLAQLGIAPTLLGAVAPGWLVQYRRHGRFAGSHQAA
jgi:NADH dehydrogenase